MLSRWPFGIAATLAAAIAVAVELTRLFRRIRAGVPAVRPAGAAAPARADRWWRRAAREVEEVAGQRRLLHKAVPGIAHAVTFWGFLVLLTTVVEAYGALFSSNFALPGIGHSPVLGLLEDLAIAAVLAATACFTILRLVGSPRRLGRASRFYGSDTAAGYLTLALIAAVLVTLLGLRGAAAAGGELPYGGTAFFSHAVGTLLAPLGRTADRTIETVCVDLNVVVLCGFAVVLVRSKHLHILLAPLNVALSGGEALGGLRSTPVLDLETLDEDARIGAGRIGELSRTQLVALSTCTECGRCQARCPAWAAGKALSPKHLVMALRDELRSAPPGGGRALVPDVVGAEELWACTTCGACVAECPVDIGHVDLVVELRRHRVLMAAEFPPETVATQRNLERAGDPYGAGASRRLEWADGLDFEVPVVTDAVPAEAEVLLWVGCAGAFDQAGRATTRALATLLHRAGVGFAVLGRRETCTGDPARRLGNELLFQDKARENAATLAAVGARTVVTSCPHCFNTMANEYPALGTEVEVLHHSELLARLVADGRLVPGPLEARVTYHDSCYLARHNGIVGAPRRVLDAIPGLHRTEMRDQGRQGLCCGAGGARMWMEEPVGQRLNAQRAAQALETGATTVATACPFCTTMLADGLAASPGETPEVLDLARLLERATAAARPEAATREG